MVEYNKEDNRPVGYVVAGTPGEPTIPAGPMLNYVGLVGKYVLGSRYGYDFLEIDMWNDAEKYNLLRMFVPGTKAILSF